LWTAHDWPVGNTCGRCAVGALGGDDPHDPAHDNVIFNPQYSLLKISHRSSS
jgi:hypothetical protein